MKGEELAFLAWVDLGGLTRGRGVPVAGLDAWMDRGIGWSMADQALTPFSTAADVSWGAPGELAGEVRMMPDPATQTRINLWADQPPLNVFLCDAVKLDGTPWEACPRGFLRAALHDLEQETGLRLLAAFAPLVFDLVGHPSGDSAGTAPPGPPFTLEAFRAVPDFGALVVRALREAGIEPETFGPERGLGQFGVSCRPAFGIAAADLGAIAREVVREVARRMGCRAGFSPALGPDRPGNGAPIRFSLQRETLPAGFDAARPGGLSEVAGQFAAGILRHLPALCAVTAPSVVSYFRLDPDLGPGYGPGGGGGYACCAIGDGGAGLRVHRGRSGIPLQAARQFHLEYRPSDSAANPYLSLALLVRAGLQGIREGLPPPPLVEGALDPGALDETERRRLGIRRLPGSLPEALDALERDATVRAWFPPELLAAYLAVKRAEIVLTEGVSPQEICDRYRQVY